MKRLGFVYTHSIENGNPGTLSIRPHHLSWHVLSPREVFTSGPFASFSTNEWRETSSGEQHNLVLDQAYDLLPFHGVIGLAQYAVVGVGNLEPTRESKGLTSEVARTSRPSSWGGTDTVISKKGASSYLITVYREFSEQEVGGRMLTEWGFSPVPEPGANLAVAERFKDQSGFPAPVVLDKDQRLRLVYTYEVRLSPTLSDVNIRVEGLGEVRGSFGFRSAPTDVSGAYLLDYLVSGMVRSENLGLPKISLHALPSPSYGDARGLLASKEVLLADYVEGERQRRTLPTPFYPEDFSISGQRAPIIIRSISLGYQEARFFITFFDTGIPVDGLHLIKIGSFSVSW